MKFLCRAVLHEIEAPKSRISKSTVFLASAVQTRCYRRLYNVQLYMGINDPCIVTFDPETLTPAAKKLLFSYVGYDPGTT